MVSSGTTNFCKSEDCPPSQELLDYQIGDIEWERGVDLRIHMGNCEFCSAEVEFYSRFPQMADDNDDGPSEIPASLFQLAQSLLSRSDGSALSLNALRKTSKAFSPDVY